MLDGLFHSALQREGCVAGNKSRFWKGALEKKIQGLDVVSCPVAQGEPRVFQNLLIYGMSYTLPH